MVGSGEGLREGWGVLNPTFPQLEDTCCFTACTPYLYRHTRAFFVFLPENLFTEKRKTVIQLSCSRSGVGVGGF